MAEEGRGCEGTKRVREGERARVVVLLPAPFAPSSLINGELGFLISNTPLGLAVSSLLLADNGDVEGLPSTPTTASCEDLI